MWRLVDITQMLDFAAARESLAAGSGRVFRPADGVDRRGSVVEFRDGSRIAVAATVRGFPEFWLFDPSYPSNGSSPAHDRVPSRTGSHPTP